jgi:periplasmic protein TonB
LSGAAGPPQKVVQEIHMIRPPPPPPDEPPPPPPPPEEKVEVQEPQQQPDPTPSNDPPPMEQLGLDAEGSAGGDAFGLLGNKGGRDLLASGGGSAFAWYSNRMQSEIRDCLAQEKSASRDAVRVRLWLREDGTIDHVRLAESTGSNTRDKTIESKLEGCRRFSPPPAGTPQPITVRLAFRS